MQNKGREGLFIHTSTSISDARYRQVAAKEGEKETAVQFETKNRPRGIVLAKILLTITHTRKIGTLRTSNQQSEQRRVENARGKKQEESVARKIRTPEIRCGRGWRGAGGRSRVYPE